MPAHPRRRFAGRALLWLLGALLAHVPAASAQSSEQVAVVINEASRASQEIGEYYARRRGLPPSNVIRIRTSTDETIARAQFVATIQAPIGAAIAREGLHDRILYLVLTKDVPLRIAGTVARDGTMSSVDSEMTLLYRRLAGQNVAVRGMIDNPYFHGRRPIGEARPFTHREHDIYLVSRLDAFTVEDAQALVDRALAPSTDGQIVLDQRDALVNRTAEDWLADAGAQLTALGHGRRVVLETSPKPARGITPVLGYYSWGSIDPQNRVRTTGLGFARGSLAATLSGTDARTFRPPPDGWTPTGDLVNRAGWFLGSPHTLLGDLIREGVTGAAGYVAEPFLQSVIRPEILFAAYLSGFNLVESFYLAMPHLGWQTIVIGDPLCAPFPRKSAAAADLDPGVDQQTRLPRHFAARRMERAQAELKASPEAVAAVIRAEGRLMHADAEGARREFERALEVEPKLVTAQLQLALLDERAGKTDAAIEGYRKVIGADAGNAVALNNLAYALSVHRKSPAEAKPLAERALKAAPQDLGIMDTLGWIEYLLGNHAAAVKLLAIAARGAPNHPDIRLHLAFASAAAGARAAAAFELDAAIKLNPSLAERDDVQKLREKVKGAGQRE